MADTSYDDAMRIVCGIVESQMAWPSMRMLATDLQHALAVLGDKSYGAEMREFAGWLSADIPELHTVEVPRLAASLERFLASRCEPVTCQRCGKPMTYTATAPIVGAPMEWRCFACVDLGNVAVNNGEHVIEIDAYGQVSEPVRGPIRDGS